LDVTVDELVTTFSKAGIISKDPVTREYKIKIVDDEKGNTKGEALIKFYRPESINIANTIIQGFPLRFDGTEPVTFELATTEQRKLIQHNLKRKKRNEII